MSFKLWLQQKFDGISKQKFVNLQQKVAVK